MDRPFVLGIAGGSGSGKTTFAQALRARLGDGHCTVVTQDSYYIDQSDKFDGDGGSVNFDHPDSLEFSLLAKHIELLKKKYHVDIPVYDFATHSRLDETHRIDPITLILVDGILLLSQDDVREALDLSVFIDCPEDLRFERRLFRDVRERGRTEDGVRAQFYNHVKPMHDQFVEPSKGYADLILSGQSDLDSSVNEFVGTLEKMGLHF